MSPQGPQRLGAEGFSGANISGSEIFSFPKFYLADMSSFSSRSIDVYSYQSHHSSIVFNKIYKIKFVRFPGDVFVCVQLFIFQMLQEPGGCSIHSSHSSDQMPEMIESI